MPASSAASTRTREALILSHSYIDEDARYDKAMDSLRTVKGYWEHVDLPVPEELIGLIAEYNKSLDACSNSSHLARA